MHSDSFSIGVVGAGFSGALLAVHLLHRCRPGDRVYLIEKRAGFGRGLAYSTVNQNHLLNVRAGNMSAFQDRPDHFVEWLRRQRSESSDPPVDSDSFVSRRLYGTYVRSLLCDELWSGGKGTNLYLVPDQGVALHEAPDGVSLVVAGGRCYRLDAVVFAAGNMPPDRNEGAYFGNPWDPAAIAGIPKHSPVLLIGTGLTMVDIVLSLLDAQHRGPIRAISRRGLLPQVHRTARPLDLAAWDLPRTTSITRLAHWVRSRVREAAADGWDWRSVVDGLRPHLQDLWRRLSLEERRRFLRHLRPWWDVHRHRMAPVVAEQIQAAMTRGQLSIGACRVVDMAPSDSQVRITLRPRHGDVETAEYARVINCSGPETDYRACDDPLINDLLRRGFARPDPLGLGLQVSEQGALLSSDGKASSRLFALGPVTRGSFWEIVAVPDIRMHCARLAAYLETSVRERNRAEPSVRRQRGIISSPPEERLANAVPPLLRPTAKGA
ncbi:MAG: FAD/NAD(P)-binding protein [Rhodospirillales bacterium]|nr:FAD/NAD(P)-binding protein [Rhodospirillales bacterium]